MEINEPRNDLQQLLHSTDKNAAGERRHMAKTCQSGRVKRAVRKDCDGRIRLAKNVDHLVRRAPRSIPHNIDVRSTWTA